MKLECTQDALRKATMQAGYSTGKNLALPVLSAILYIADGSALKLRATNLNVGIEVTIPAKIEKPGIAAVPGSVVNNFLASLGADTSVYLELKNNNLALATRHTKTTINTLPYDDFPTLPTIAGGITFTMPIKSFMQGLRAVSYSAAVSDIKPELSSVYIYTDRGSVVFAATDGFRLAEKRIQIALKDEIPPLLIPLKNVMELLRLFEGEKGDVEIACTLNQISFVFENIYFTSRLIDGVFPDYKQIIPKTHTTEVIILKADFGSALKIANVFSDTSHQVSLVSDLEKKYFEVYSKNADIGENTTILDATVAGEPVDLAFSHRALTDVFQSIDKDSLILHFSGEGKPIVIKPAGDASFMYLVMPINR